MAKLTPTEKRAREATFPKCRCGNVLSLQRQADGINLCPRCEAYEGEKQKAAFLDKLWRSNRDWKEGK